MSSTRFFSQMQVDTALLVPCCGKDAKPEPYTFPELPEGAAAENVTALQPADYGVPEASIGCRVGAVRLTGWILSGSQRVRLLQCHEVLAWLTRMSSCHMPAAVFEASGFLVSSARRLEYSKEVAVAPQHLT